MQPSKVLPVIPLRNAVLFPGVSFPIAAGRPVIAFGAGGALETVVDGVTGRFFHEPTAAAVAAAVAAARTDRYDPLTIRRHAESFGRPVFLERMRALIDETVEAAREPRPVRTLSRGRF